MIHHNVVISVLALHNNLKEAGLTRKILHKIAHERDEELWAQWREMQRDPHMQGDQSEFVCLDETSKNKLSYACQYGLAPSGQHAELKDVFVCSDRYSLLAAMTVYGYLATHVVPGSYDSLEFYKFVQEKVVRPEIKFVHLVHFRCSFHTFSLSQLNDPSLCSITAVSIITRLSFNLCKVQVSLSHVVAHIQSNIHHRRCSNPLSTCIFA